MVKASKSLDTNTPCFTGRVKNYFVLVFPFKTYIYINNGIDFIIMFIIRF